MSFQDKVAVITGSTRGIGREIALKLAKEGANIVILGKTENKHAKLPGTIFSVAEEVEQYGVKALPIALDLRKVDSFNNVISKINSNLGSIDILVNNASALKLQDIQNLSLREWDLIHQVNSRGTYFFIQACLNSLLEGKPGQILTVSPPINLDQKWFASHLAYTISKYSMSMCTVGLAAKYHPDDLRVNSLWPKYLLATSAVKYNLPENVFRAARDPKIMADAAAIILGNLDSSGKFYIDEEVIKAYGDNHLEKYTINPDINPISDLFI